MTSTPPSKDRRRALRDAETNARTLFEEAARRDIVRPGATETGINEAMYALAFEMFGVRKYWHKRIVRSGENTVRLYRENPPDRTILDDDIVFFDFGPIFEDWEADLGRTYVLGNDPDMLRIQRDIEQVWLLGKQRFDAEAAITGSQLFDYVRGQCRVRGWEYAITHSGHLIGEFPHADIHREGANSFIRPDNLTPLRDPDKDGLPRDWILELHFVDPAGRFGAFFEQLLNVD